MREANEKASKPLRFKALVRETGLEDWPVHKGSSIMCNLVQLFNQNIQFRVIPHNPVKRFLFLVVVRSHVERPIPH